MPLRFNKSNAILQFIFNFQPGLIRLSMPLNTLRIAGARITEHKLDVDGFSKNHVENIYAVGDVLYQKPELTAVVIEEGRIVTGNFFIEFKRLKKT